MLATCVMIGVMNLPVIAPPGPAQRLRNEAFAVRRRHVELLLKTPLDVTDYAVYERTGAVVRRLADAEAAAGNPAAGVKWAERWRETLLTVVVREERRGGNGPTPIYEMYNALIEADLDLNRRREAVKGGPLLTPAEKLRLCTWRLDVSTKLEKLYEKNFRDGNGSEAEYLIKKIARLEAEAELAQLKESAKAGK